ncbi:WecB/TagA/CpsF family glycosyltransferase [Radicibacter daui]|uniref:WecB/TagA/CpsF family glycosyltransferase n=1 Tax=Radicibacter daui TaxID=3064829 RepID=UPI0040469CCA
MPVETSTIGERRVSVLGVPVDPWSIEDGVELACAIIAEGQRGYICHLDARSIIAARRDAAVQAAVRSALIAGPDGMPVVWLARRKSAFGASRFYGPDFMNAMLEQSGRPEHPPLRHVLFGSTPAVLARLENELARRYPLAMIVGAFSPGQGPWSDEEERDQCARIDACKADIVWVGLGAPKQELWMARNRHRLQAALLVGVGAAFDFLSGSKPQAPLWMQRHGLEWIFRLASEPRRLAGRYAVTVPTFLVLAAYIEFLRPLVARIRSNSAL